jgi:hypothetical protein
MKTLFSTYGIAPVKVVLNLYTEGTEDVSWVKGIDEVTGFGLGINVRTLTEGVDFATLQIISEPATNATNELAYVTNEHQSVNGYTNVLVDWEAISAGDYALIVDNTKNGDFNDFQARATYGTGTGRKTTSLSLSGLSGNKFIRVNSYTDVFAPDTANTTIRIHRVWFEQ